nr:shikimate kinase [Deltaproteobacteria bacterium]
MIFLTGFMGSGKTTVGEDLAHRTGAPFVDLDEVIARKSGTSIADIFRCAGEEAFRALEDTALKETAAQGGPSCIVATGGGLPVSPLNRKLMKSCGSIVYLKSSFENLELRIAQDGSRPLWNSGARDLLKKRIPAYEDADLAVDIDSRRAED